MKREMKKIVSIFMMLALMLVVSSKISYAEPIDEVDLSVGVDYLLASPSWPVNIVNVTSPSGLADNEKIIVFDKNDNVMYKAANDGQDNRIWKDPDGQVVTPVWKNAAYALDFVTIRGDGLSETTIVKKDGTALNEIEPTNIEEGYYYIDTEGVLAVTIRLDVPDEAFEVDGTIYSSDNAGNAVGNALHQKKPLEVIKDVTIDLGPTYDISGNLIIIPRDDDVTITLKTQFRLEAGNKSASLVLGDDSENTLTVQADMDQRWFATREGLIVFNQNVILDGRNHIYNVDGPLVTVQKVGQEGNLTVDGAIIRNFRTTGNGGAIINAGIINFESVPKIENCYAFGNGGAIHNSGSITMSAETLITCCDAEGNGGAIYNNYDGTLTMNDSSNILECSALNGGGVYSVGTLSMNNNSMISECTARKTDEYQSGKGGAIYMYPESNVLTLTGEAKLYHNTADKGGAIYLGALTPLTITGTDVRLYQNSSYVLDTFNSDPAIYIHENPGTITGLTDIKFLYNQLIVSSSGSKTYKAKDTNKTVEKISGSGKKGSKRTITPIEGKKVGRVTVTDKNGNKVEVTKNEDGTFSFIQPASDVQVEVTYVNREITLNIGSTEASVDGERSNLDVCPVIRNDRTMLPIRFVAENLGAKVEWDEKNPNYVLITKGDIKIEITLGSDVMKVNGKDVKLDSVAFAENDRTYLPVRAVSENLNAIVEWNEQRPMEVKIYER